MSLKYKYIYYKLTFYDYSNIFYWDNTKYYYFSIHILSKLEIYLLQRIGTLVGVSLSDVALSAELER